VGGGFISVPLLTSFCGLTQHQANGTALAGVLASSITGAYTLYTYGNETDVDIKSSLVIGSTALITAPAGAYFSKKIPSAILKRYFAFLILAMIPVTLAKPYFSKESVDINTQSLVDISLWNIPLLLTIGGFSGFLSGVFGIGGGIFMVSFLSTLTHQQQAMGTSLLSILFPAISGSIAHFRLGNIVVPLLPALFIGSMIGARIGGKLVVKMKDTQQRYLFVALALLIGLKNLLKL